MTLTCLVSDDIERFLKLIGLPDQVRELRIPRSSKFNYTLSGYFNTPQALVKAAAHFNGKSNVYFTLNPVNPALLARANNHVEKAQYATADSDIVHRDWLFLDIDPVRPSGISATEEEREAALGTLSKLTGYLAAAGWPDPVTAMSGNGYYALYRIDLPNDQESKAVVQAVLESLATRFDTSAVHLDKAVSNASRMAALIGTVKCKGENMPDRPHRRSCLISAPESLSVVQEDMLHALASQAMKSTVPSRSARAGSHDLRDILDQKGIEYRVQPPDSQGFTWYHVQQCPFHDDGQPFECGVGQKLPDGPYAGHCFHPEGVGKGWQEWKRALDLQMGHSDSTGELLSQPVPAIVATGRQLPDITSDALTALVQANDPPVVFVRNGELVRLISDENSRVSIQRLSDAALRGHLARAARWHGFNKRGEDIEVPPPKVVVEDMAALPAWQGLPTLAGIVFAPMLRKDGSILSQQGYDTSSRLYYKQEQGLTIPSIPASPTTEDVSAALEIVNDIFAEFPWASSSDRANAYAALITQVVRETINGCTPIFGIDAPRPGTGKGLLTDIMSTIATGSIAFKTTPPGAGNEDEWRKLLLGIALDGHPVAVLDNVEGTLKSGSLAGFSTTSIYSGRIMGSNKTVNVPNRAVLMLTGNNISLAGDLPRRVIPIRLDPQMARPWEREGFTHPDLLAFVRQNRGAILGALLVLARSWYTAGEPKADVRSLGSFEDWTVKVGGILQHVGIQGFLGNMAESYERMDESTPAWESFLTAWFEDSQERTLTVAQLIERIRNCAALIEALPDELADQWAAQANGTAKSSFARRLGKALAARQDVIYSNLKLVRGPRDTHGKVSTWRVEKVAGYAGFCGISPTPNASSYGCVGDELIDRDKQIPHIPQIPQEAGNL